MSQGFAIAIGIIFFLIWILFYFFMIDAVLRELVGNYFGVQIRLGRDLGNTVGWQIPDRKGFKYRMMELLFYLFLAIWVLLPLVCGVYWMLKKGLSF